MVWNGPPKDVEGKCNSRLEIADDYGDNSATMLCQLKPGHEGNHQEKYKSYGDQDILVTWSEEEG